MSNAATTDLEQIRDLVHRYADAVCRRDKNAWAATWAADANWDLGRGVVSGRDAIVEVWVNAMGMFRQVVQNVMNGAVDVEGESATGRWYIMEHYERTDGSRGILLAAYMDSYTRTAEGWQFTNRSLDRFYAGDPDLSGEFVVHSA